MLARKYAAAVLSTLRRLLDESDETRGGGGGGELLGFGEERLGWALDMVHSRSFSVDMGGVRGVRRVLVPARGHTHTVHCPRRAHLPSEHC